MPAIGYVPQSRSAMLFREERIYRNVCVALLESNSRWLLRPANERAQACEHTQRLGVRPPGVKNRLGALSGGNQQQVALAKWLTRSPKVLVLMEPTRGMDVGAKEDVVRIVKSRNPETVLSLADRVIVMRKGEIACEFADCAISKDRLLMAG